MSSINIFYHVLCINDFKGRFDKTYTKIKNSGLLDRVASIHVICVGEYKAEGAEYFKKYEKVITYTDDNSSDESPTLIRLWEFCQHNDTNVLYLHSKGVTRAYNENIEAWIDYMEYFCIEQYEKCLKALQQYDTCGVNFSHEPMKHYSGNFWWANGNFIKSRSIYDVSLSSKINDQRWYCEFWLLDTLNVNPVSMHQTNLDLYTTKYTREQYERNS